MRIKTWQYITIGLLVLGFTGLVALHAWLTPYDLKQERAAARAAGLPLTNADLPRTRPPRARDAGPEWQALAKDMKGVVDVKAVDALAGPNGTLPPEAMPDARRFLKEHAGIVARIHRAAANEHAFFEHTYTSDEMFPYYAQMREAAKMVRWESLLLAREGRYAEAVRTQELGLNIADQAAEEPTLIGMLVSIAIDAISTRGMEDILREAGPDARVAGMVANAIRRHPSKINLSHALQGETLFGMNTIRSVQSMAGIRALSGGSGGPAPAPRKADPLMRYFFLDQNEAGYLHWMNRQYRAAQLPPAERIPAMKRIEGEMERRMKYKQPANLMPAILLPVISKAAARAAGPEAHHAVVLAAAEVLAHKDRTGTFPATLAEAMKAPPTDPYSRKPVGYRREGDGFVVYSVGREGAFQAKPGQPEKGEAVFRYPNATPAAGKP